MKDFFCDFLTDVDIVCSIAH